MTLLKQNHLLPDIRQTISQYLNENSELQAISTFEAIQVVRERISQCDLSDRELSDLIAKSAIDVGFGVSFDGDRNGS